MTLRRARRRGAGSCRCSTWSRWASARTATSPRCSRGRRTLDAGERAICLGVHDSPKPPPERITLSLAVLRAARRCLLLATGAGKADAIAAALAEPTKHVPASLLVRERLTVIVDDAASPPPGLG